MTGSGADRVTRRTFLGRAGAAALAVLAGPLLPRAARASETARAWRSMGTLLEVRVPDLPPAEAVEAIRKVRRRLAEMEAAMTLFREDAPLPVWNRSRPGSWVHVPEDLIEGVAAALDGARRFPGAFDPTVAPLMRAYGLQDLDPREPDPGFLRAWRGRPGPDAVEIDVRGRRLRRLHPAVELDLGGVGKGMAVDAALAVLRRAGSRAALVNHGGAIGVLGPPPDDSEGWPVGIAHPREPGAIWRTVRLRGGHLATSGDYERWVDTPRGRRHHLLDPRAGVPVPGVASVTVWRETGLGADPASTAMFVRAGRGEALEGPCLVLEERDGELVESGGGAFAAG